MSPLINLKKNYWVFKNVRSDNLISHFCVLGILALFTLHDIVDIMQLNDMVSENEKKYMLSELNANWLNLTARH